MDHPSRIRKDISFDSFSDGNILPVKKKGILPPMGWNSWNAFGSGNTEDLTIKMAEKIKELGLDKFGYEYVVLDDGCYLPDRVEDKLTNEPVKFPSGFKSLSDKIHSMGLKFGMYNDVGRKTCAGAEVGLYKHEKIDAKSYSDWNIDFIKVDNCYYMWDNATFADPGNAVYTFAPKIKNITVDGVAFDPGEMRITGERAYIEDGSVVFIGTFDGTSPERTPTGLQSSEIQIDIMSDSEKDSDIRLTYATGREEGQGGWVQIAVGDKMFYDDLLPESPDKDTFISSSPIRVKLRKGQNTIRIMNHRRQENTIGSYVTFLEELRRYDPDNRIVLSLCEWGKTSPHNWGYKVGNSWRILNDITFTVGSAEGDFGSCTWEGDYTTNITAQYNKAVIMDEYSGLDKGWNDPDMLVIGMNGLSDTINDTHMAMWCMLNAPLMLGLDLRRVNIDDDIYKIITNEDYISLDQDALGIQAKRIFTTINVSDPSKDYIRDNKRIDVLVKPLSDGSIAVGFFNLDKEDRSDDICISFDEIEAKMDIPSGFLSSDEYRIKDLKSKETWNSCEKRIRLSSIKGCASYLVKITPV